MSYWFEPYKYRFPILVKGQSMALFIGNRRLGPTPKIVWWYPPNWVLLLVLIILSPIALIKMRKLKTKKKEIDR